MPITPVFETFVTIYPGSTVPMSFRDINIPAWIEGPTPSCPCDHGLFGACATADDLGYANCDDLTDGDDPYRSKGQLYVLWEATVCALKAGRFAFAQDAVVTGADVLPRF